ncbi:hypothetical protein [Shewanella gaetbuli]|uniref:Uncharacterized protein n=1 Tax=Shewanella gaetbuli TaxID=220752 RepID=A0A9X1ZJL7_9GAMM|nr:hypothetical protein [Shewanella gaetbuli]MCL1142958.1 hypothetical protein [Shewanella gaetbuli]
MKPTVNYQVPLKLKKGMRYSAAVAAAIAVGFSHAAMAEPLNQAKEDLRAATADLINALNRASGAESLNPDADYFHNLIHRAKSLTFQDGEITLDVPEDTVLYVMAGAPYDAAKGKVDVSELTLLDGISPLASVVAEKVAAFKAIYVEIEDKQERLYFELQKMPSLSAILKRYPDAIYYMPKDMVEPAQCESLDALLKSA